MIAYCIRFAIDNTWGDSEARCSARGSHVGGIRCCTMHACKLLHME